jgi:hypothetical protein
MIHHSTYDDGQAAYAAQIAALKAEQGAQGITVPRITEPIITSGDLRALLSPRDAVHPGSWHP